MAKNFNVNATVGMSGSEFIKNEYYKSNTYQAYVVTFTPKDMQALLDKCNTHNRRATPNTIDSYSNQMSKGKWIENSGDTASFDIYGRLIDSQHRFLSAIKANKNLTTIVAVGCSPDAFYFKDTNKMRTCLDILSIYGVGSDIGFSKKEAEEFTKYVASCVKTTLNIVNGSASEHGSATTRTSAPTNEEATLYYSEHKQIFNNSYAIHNKCKNMSGYRLFPKKKFFDALSNIAQMQGHSVEFIMSYFEKLFGTNYGESQPVCELREYMTSVKNKNRNWNSTRVWNAYMMSWKAYVLGFDTKITDKTIEDQTVTFYTLNTRKKATITMQVEPVKAIAK